MITGGAVGQETRNLVLALGNFHAEIDFGSHHHKVRTGQVSCLHLPRELLCARLDRMPLPAFLAAPLTILRGHFHATSKTLVQQQEPLGRKC